MSESLVDVLRTLSDEGLGAFLTLRPDLLVPAPTDLSSLASRAQGRASVARALDPLDQFTLEVLDALRFVRDGTGAAAVDRLLTLTTEAGIEPGLVRAALDRLRARMLIYGSDEHPRLVPAVDELLPTYPVGLGRPAAELDDDVAELVADAAGLRRVLLSAAPEARAVLDRLAAGPPIGSVQPAILRPKTQSDSPVRWLVEHKLLVPITDDTVELPREVGIVLRREHGPLGPLHPLPPDVEAPIRTGADSAGAGQALEAVRHLDAVLQSLSEQPAPLLRTFGLGVRDLRRIAKETGTNEADVALLLEIAYAAGLLTYTEATGRGDQYWLPSPTFDTWRAAPLATRWARLARTWLETTRSPGMVGQRDDKDKPIAALSYEASRLSAPAMRRAALEVLAAMPTDAALAADGVIERLSWRIPRRVGRSGSTAVLLARAAVTEAATLGVTGLGALTSYGRILLAETPPDPDEDPLGVRSAARTDLLLDALAGLLPEPVEHVLVQADLTVVVPGPPEPGLANELALVADTESRGGATVYRVTPASVRRALDSGLTAADVHEVFTRRSRTALPQTLTYLVDDVARRHGGLRLGTASSYLRSDDEALLSEVMVDRRLAPLALRRLAPTVVISGYATTRLLDALREAGYSPVAEGPDGTTVITRQKPPRGPNRPPPRSGRPDEFDQPHMGSTRMAAVVAQMRLGDRLARVTKRSPLGRSDQITSTQAHTQALAVLQQAMRDQVRVWVGYVDAHGDAASRLVRPVSMAAGYLRAEDDRTEMLHTFALHRITSAALDE